MARVSGEILMVVRNICLHCDGKGYIQIRDCSGEVQHEETCSWCNGSGYVDRQDDEKE